MYRRIFPAVLAATLLAWPLSALADAPPNVTGIAAHFENGQIAIRWETPDAGDIAAYRIYYGQRSILDNNGAYDDFVATAGRNSSLVMTDFPPYPQIFLSVLAVNGAGEESRSFVEEVQIDVGGGTADGQAKDAEAPSPSRKQWESTTVGLSAAAATSPTTIQLMFTSPVSIPVDRAAEAFAIVDTQGNRLGLRRIIIEGSSVTLTTDPQVAGREYGMRVSDVVTSNPLVGPLLSMDANRSIASFTGFGSPGIAPSPSEQPTQVPTNAPLVAAVVSSDQKPASRKLFSAGVPVAGAMMVSGAIVGWKRMKKRTRSGDVPSWDGTEFDPI